MSKIDVTTPAGRKLEIGEYDDDSTRRHWAAWVDDGRYTVFIPGDGNDDPPVTVRSKRGKRDGADHGWNVD